jgi:hypothetical protein
LLEGVIDALKFPGLGAAFVVCRHTLSRSPAE